MTGLLIIPDLLDDDFHQPIELREITYLMQLDAGVIKNSRRWEKNLYIFNVEEKRKKKISFLYFAVIIHQREI